MQRNIKSEPVYNSLMILEENYMKLSSKKGSSKKVQNELGLICKLSVMEFCGWVELMIDEVFFSYISKRISDSNLADDARKELKNVFGCDPDTDIKRIVIAIIGYRAFERYNKRHGVEWSQIASSIKMIGGRVSVGGKNPRIRDIAAHTNYDISSPSQKYFNTPSVALCELKRLFPLLKNFKKHILSC